MGDIRNEPNQDVLFVLQYEEISILELEQEPVNWDEGALQIVRNKKYHGILTEFTDALEFDNEAKDYILNAYSNGGINANLYLIKYEQSLTGDYVGSDESVRWNLIYRGIADFTSMKEKKARVTLNFNSDELEQLLKSHEGDAFEIERLSSLNAKIGVGGISGLQEDLQPIQLNSTILRPRNFGGVGKHSSLNKSNGEGFLSRFKIPYNDQISVPTTFGEKAFPRHVEVVNDFFTNEDRFDWEANMFYTDLPIEDRLIISSIKVTIDIDATFKLESGQPSTNQVRFRLREFIFNPSTGYEQQGVNGNGGNMFDIQLDEESGDSNKYRVLINNTPQSMLIDQDTGLPTNVIEIPLEGGIGIPYNHAYAMCFCVNSWAIDDEPNFDVSYQITRWDIQVEEESEYIQESTEKNKFAFVNEVGERLMEIMTGQKNRFYSKLFARKYNVVSPSSGQIKQYQDPIYERSGEYGGVGLVHGFSVRRFNNGEHELYKPLTMSMKKLIESLQSNFNIGVGIEKGKEGDVVRFEKLEYFYQDTVAVVLPQQIYDVTREVDGTLFASACEFGSEKGGDYENEIGLDEPNVKLKFTTPLRKTDTKYQKMSTIRSDDYGREILRRKPVFLDEKADMSGDDDVWYLDLRQDREVTYPMYKQWRWDDTAAVDGNGDPITYLNQLPTGIANPETYQSWRFTPKRSFLRHGWVLRAGMEVPTLQDSSFILSEGKGNINLATQMYNEPFNVIESSTQKVTDLERSRVLPEIIKFKHPATPELRRLILGTTEIEIQGTRENVPNWYFRFQWVNENEDIETGYLRSYKEKSDQFEFIKANENIIF